MVGVEPLSRVYDGHDPVAYVLSLNLRRRHLTTSQRSMVAARIANLGHGQNKQESPFGDSVTQQEAGDLLGVGKHSVERARTILDHGTPELQQAVDAGEVTVTAAARQAVDKRSEMVDEGMRLSSCREPSSRRNLVAHGAARSVSPAPVSMSNSSSVFW